MFYSKGLMTLTIITLQLSLIGQTQIHHSYISDKIDLEDAFLEDLNQFLDKYETAEDDFNLTDDKFLNDVLEELSYYENKGKDSTQYITRELINYNPLAKNKMTLQLASYLEDSTNKELISIWNLIAHRTDTGYTFSSPIDYYTHHWKTQKVGNIYYHFRDSIQLERAIIFADKNKDFSTKFKKPEQEIHFYMTPNYQEILKLIGIDYCKNAIGKIRDGWGVVGGNIIFSIMNNEDFSHDLFHFYAGTKHERKSRNWVTEEGVAYSWGNAYYTTKSGEMADQKELVQIFKAHQAKNSDFNLLDLFENNFYDDESGIYDHMAPDFKVGRLLCSLICDAVEEKHGMEGLNQLIACGSEPDRFTAFFKTTNELIGLNKVNFNDKVQTLLNNFQ